MNDSTSLPLTATARLIMDGGNPCSIAELAIFLEQFDYVQDPQDDHRFVLRDDDGQGVAEQCSIAIADLSVPVELIDVYGQAVTHFGNLNYLMQRAGWESCKVLCRDADVSAKLLARLVSVDVTSTDEVLPASSLEPNPATPTPRYQVQQVSSHAGGAVSGSTGADVQLDYPPALPDTYGADPGEEELGQLQKVRALTIQVNGLQEQLEVAQSEANQYRQQYESLLANVERTTTPGDAVKLGVGHVGPSGAQPLMGIVDKYLLSNVDLHSADRTGLLEDLRDAGYGVALRLIVAS